MAKRKRPQSGVRFARVPSGGETCPFCMMLASRGAVYYSEQTAGADGHYHPNCRCRIVPSWGTAEIEGYDPDLYYDMWKHPEKYAAPKDGTSIAAELAEDAANQMYSDAYERLKHTMELEGVEYVPPIQYAKQPTQAEIIERIGGGDLTSGSCSSLALAYIGNEAGLEVLDFRGGRSTNVFSRVPNLKDIIAMPGVKGIYVEDFNAYKAVYKMLESVEIGKEYYMSCAKHAAIVRKIGDKHFEYLELQSATDNGFKRLTNDVLRWRFGAQKQKTQYGVKFPFREFLIEADSLANCAEFRELLGYINTPAAKQKKGSSGYAK